MKLTNHFTLEEFTTSSTAKKKNIDNTPTKEALDNIKQLALVLEYIRLQWGEPIKINSGYRCKSLNKAVGGASNSAHLYGAAADIVPANGDTKGLFNLISSLMQMGEIKIRTLIDEYNYKWIHIDINNANNVYRNNAILHLK